LQVISAPSSVWLADSVGHAEVTIVATSCWVRPAAWDLGAADVVEGTLELTVASSHGLDVPVTPCEFKIGYQQVKRSHMNIEGVQKAYRRNVGGIQLLDKGERSKRTHEVNGPTEEPTRRNNDIVLQWHI
jgi:hypothetical protein